MTKNKQTKTNPLDGTEDVNSVDIVNNDSEKVATVEALGSTESVQPRANRLFRKPAGADGVQRFGRY